jgi:hypothetical protein
MTQATRSPPLALGASRALGLLDELRVPYDPAATEAGADGWARLGAAGGGTGLHWHAGPGGAVAGAWRVGDVPVWGDVAPGAEVARLARRLGGDWRPEIPVTDAAGATCSWIWRAGDGGSILPFDPDALLLAFRSEAYRRPGPGGRAGPAAAARGAAGAATRRAYYAARPLLPRRAQIALRRAFTRVQERAAFPRWPLETALHDLGDLVLARVADAAGAPVPHLAPWPDGRAWALVLTHDVEHAAGRDAIERVRGVEAALGLRSSWNLVPERYAVPDELVARLWSAGCEVGVHGLRHDGRDLASLRTLRRRLPEMRRWAERWGAAGFRSPATHRVWEWMPLLGFDYDSSSPDTDPYEPVAGGCCSWLPFFNRDLVELPITLPQDHTLFVLLREDETPWLRKAAALRARGGMALMITHPDYLLEDGPLETYRRFLLAFGGDPTAWHALPHEVAQWWRRRAATSLEPGPGGWRAVGPAAGRATVAYAAPEG